MQSNVETASGTNSKSGSSKRYKACSLLCETLVKMTKTALNGRKNTISHPLADPFFFLKTVNPGSEFCTRTDRGRHFHYSPRNGSTDTEKKFGFRLQRLRLDRPSLADLGSAVTE
ncbi:hypothetical protein SRHO_G00332280 [Serrasalmus rhombeus]